MFCIINKNSFFVEKFYINRRIDTPVLYKYYTCSYNVLFEIKFDKIK